MNMCNTLLLFSCFLVIAVLYSRTTGPREKRQQQKKKKKRTRALNRQDPFIVIHYAEYNTRSAHTHTHICAENPATHPFLPRPNFQNRQQQLCECVIFVNRFHRHSILFYSRIPWWKWYFGLLLIRLPVYSMHLMQFLFSCGWETVKLKWEIYDIITQNVRNRFGGFIRSF